ncbi:MAG TPA: hypothetical protein VE035_12335 [Puia sp.]|nr:hypothetical protein [Puia sp.]
MKKLSMFFCVYLFCHSVQAQWTTSGSDIYYTTGSVSINTTTPVEKLTINGNALADKFRLNNLSTPTSGAGIFAPVASTLAIYTSTLERMRVAANGYVGIGTTAPAFPLDVTGTGHFSSLLNIGSTTTTNTGLNINSADQVNFNITTGGSTDNTIGIYAAGGSNGNNYAVIGNSVVGINLTTRSYVTPYRLLIGPTDMMDVFATGNVGIGTNNIDSGFRLDLNGSARMKAAVRFAGLGTDNTQTRVVVGDANGNLFYRAASTLGSGSSGWALTGNTTVNPATTFLGTTDNTPVAFRTNNAERMRVDVNGNILVGKTSQTNTSYVFDVNGNARATSIVVNTTGADYVFGADYALPSLKMVDKYINEHHHLPGIAPAEEMQKKGVDLGDNQTRMLAKIEELTLYIIEQQKQIEALQEQNRKIEIAQQQKRKRENNIRHIRK